MITISDKLAPAAALNPTKTSQTKSVFDMCADIENNRISLPLYQRDLSWSVKKAVSLFNYQLFGRAPVSPISMNQIEENNEIPQISFMDRKRLDNAAVVGNLSIVDGQQRLATNFRAYEGNSAFKNVVLNVSIPRFEEIKSGKPLRNSQIPVGVLLNKDASKLKNYLEDRHTLSDLYPILLEVRNKLSNYNYTVHIARNLTEEQQIEWFNVLNVAGSKVTGIQIAFSELKIHNFDIYSEYVEPFVEKLKANGLSSLINPFSTHVSYPIVSLSPALEVEIYKKPHRLSYVPISSNAKKSALSKLNAEQFHLISSKTLSSLDHALQLIQNNNLAKYLVRIDYVLYLTGYFVFHDYPPEQKVSQDLVNWVKTTIFKNKSNEDRKLIYNKLLEIE